MTFHSITTSQGIQVHLQYNNNSPSFYLCDSPSSVLQKIEEVTCDFPYQQLPTAKLLMCLKNTYSHLTKLSDGNYKLYIHSRLLGGMMSQKNHPLCQSLQIGDEKVDDSTVARNISRTVPENSYASISVQTMEYTFPMQSSAKIVRRIDVKTGNWNYFKNALKALRNEPISGIIENDAISAILGSSDPTDSEELTKAFKKNYTFRIYISRDLKNFIFESNESWLTSAAEGALTRKTRCSIM